MTVLLGRPLESPIYKADFREVMTGPVGGVQIGNVSVLVRGDYQNGFDIYLPF